MRDHRLRSEPRQGHALKHGLVPITTVYIDDNRSSHFRMPWDPIRICLQFLRYAAATAARTSKRHDPRTPVHPLDTLSGR
jgi:hypothetical protein